MYAQHSFKIVPKAGEFSHAEAVRVTQAALRQQSAPTVVIDLKHVTDATTSAFARLVLLRRLLRATGRDLRIVNLRERAAGVYEISRLAEVLPRG